MSEREFETSIGNLRRVCDAAAAREWSVGESITDSLDQVTATITRLTSELAEARAERDAAGKIVDGYLLQNQDAGYLGNAPIFWASAGGYTAYIDNAKVFDESEADEIIAEHGEHKKFVKWSAAEVFGRAQRVVDMQGLRRLAELISGSPLAESRRVGRQPMDTELCPRCGSTHVAIDGDYSEDVIDTNGNTAGGYIQWCICNKCLHQWQWSDQPF